MLAKTSSTPAENYATARAGAVSGGKAMVTRHGFVAILSLAGTTALVRLIGTSDWAIAAQGYFLVVFLDYALGANLLGGLLRKAGSLTTRDTEAAARLAALAAAALLGLGCLLAGPAALALGRWEWGACLLAVGMGGAVFSARSVPVALLERDLRYGTIAVAEVLDQVSFYLLAIPAAVLGLGLPGVLAALAVRSIPSAILVHRRRPSPLLGAGHRRELRDLLAFARPTAGSAGLVLLDGLIPLAVLGASHERPLAFMLTTATIAGYAATLQIVAQRIGFASLARLQADPAGFRLAAGRAAMVSTVVIVGVIFGLAGLSSIWLPVMFGPTWEAAAWVMALLGVTMLMQSPVNIATALLNARDRPGSVLVLRISQTAPYLAVALALVAQTPLLAVPIGAAAGRATAALLAGWLVREYVGSRTIWWLVAVPAGGSVATLGLTALCHANAPLAVAVAVAGTLGWVAANRATIGTLRRSLLAGT